MTTTYNNRDYLNRLADLHSKSHADLIALARDCWPNYRPDGVDDETLIGDILEYETHHGFPDAAPKNCHTISTDVLGGVLY